MNDPETPEGIQELVDLLTELRDEQEDSRYAKYDAHVQEVQANYQREIDRLLAKKWAMPPPVEDVHP